MTKQFKKEEAGGNWIAAKIAVAQGLPSWFSREWFWGLILISAVILTYQPVWHAGFIWDDDAHITGNPCIVGPLGLKEIWTTSYAIICPLTLTTFWVEHALWGLAPLPYHLVNVLLQGACAILLWRVLRGLRVPGAWLGAALWALHPLQVESVAWISEMKNTQSCLFYLLTILFFVKWLRARDRDGRDRAGWNYGLTLIFAALAMASKFSTVVLPVVLGLCAWWVEGRWQWRNWVRLVPIFAMSVVASAATLWPRTSELATIADPQWARSWPERVATAGDVIWFYLGKLLWPHPLITIYPRWEIDAGQWISYLPLGAVVIVLFILWRERESWARPYFFGLAYFLVVLFPFLGLIDQSFWRYSFVEDHLQYLAGMGPLALAGAGLARLADFVIPGKSWLPSTLGAAVLLILGMLSWQRAWAYESEETLWTDTLAKNPNCWAGNNSLGLVFFHQGQMDRAIEQYQRALAINPGYAVAFNNLGIALLQKGQVDHAIEQYQRALKIDPDYAEAQNNLGNALLQKGRVDEAMTQFRKALKISPNDDDLYYDLGNAFFQKGQMDEAIVQYQKALEINPNNAQAHYNLGISLSRKGEMSDAIIQFQEVVRLNPDDSNAQNTLAKAQDMAQQAPDSK